MKPFVRPARPSDKKQLMSFIKDIWGGHDYIPNIWDEWLKDPTGRMFVVEVDGVAIAMNRVRFQEDGSAWFEGMRVHPDFRNRGFASLLGKNAMRVARARGIRTFRLTSGSRNKVAHRQIARIRFEEKSRFSVYTPRDGVRFNPVKGVRKVGSDERKLVGGLIGHSKEFRLGKGVFWDNFTAISLSPKVQETLISEGSVWTTDGAAAVYRMGREGNEIWKQVCFVGGEAKGALALVEHIMSIPVKGRKLRRFVFVPHGSPLIAALRKAGFKRDFSMVLFERSANG